MMLDELKKIGLSDNEAKVYLALLELGSSTVQKISEKAGVKRPTTYVEIEALMKMGVVTTFEKAGKKDRPTKTLFRAEDPEYLKNIIEREKKLAVERERTLGDVLPELGKLFLAAGERPRVRFFEGVEGIYTIQEELLNSKIKSVKGVTSLDSLFKTFPKHTNDYTDRRIANGIRSRLIYTSSQGAILKKNDSEALRESRYIPKEKFPYTLDGDITIFGDCVAFSVLNKSRPYGVVLESPEIANTVSIVFNIAWESANKYQE